jgi:hypothetical protein
VNRSDSGSRLRVWVRVLLAVRILMISLKLRLTEDDKAIRMITSWPDCLCVLRPTGPVLPGVSIEEVANRDPQRVIRPTPQGRTPSENPTRRRCFTHCLCGR